jgi:transposase-like protein
MGKRYDKAFKEEVLGKVRSGGKVREVALSYGLSEMTVRSWLKREVTASSDLLAMSRLQRENEALYRLVGQLVYESSREKKGVSDQRKQ